MKSLIGNRKFGFINRTIAIVMCSVLAWGTLSAQGKPEIKRDSDNSNRLLATPAPVPFSGLPTCKELMDAGIPEFQHINLPWQLKLNFAPPAGPSGPYQFVTSGGVELSGGATPAPSQSVSIVRNGVFLDWSSTRFITAVIVKGPADANVYPYNPPSKGGLSDGTGLQTPSGINDYQHITFCFQEEPIVPSASTVSLAGRVISTNGRGISGVNVSSVNAATGEIKTARTNSFGYYRLDELVVGDIYVVSASSKRHQFFEGQRTITLDDNLEGYDFVAID